MRKLGHTFAAVMLAGGIAAAQDIQHKSQTKISVEDGKNVTVTGCVTRGADGGFALTNVAGKEGPLGSYLLAADGEDLDKHLGHRVEISGKAVDKGKGRIKIETKNETRHGDGEKTTTESKGEVKGDLKGLPYLGIKSMRMIASVCP
jgi:hypothetical protein